jgi:hypothetical protein
MMAARCLKDFQNFQDQKKEILKKNKKIQAKLEGLVLKLAMQQLLYFLVITDNFPQCLMTTRSLSRGGPILIFNFKFCSLPEELFAINDKQPETAGSRTSPIIWKVLVVQYFVSNFVKRPLLTYVPQDNPKPVECPFGSDEPYVPEVLEEAMARLLLHQDLCRKFFDHHTPRTQFTRIVKA